MCFFLLIHSLKNKSVSNVYMCELQFVQTTELNSSGDWVGGGDAQVTFFFPKVTFCGAGHFGTLIYPANVHVN